MTDMKQGVDEYNVSIEELILNVCKDYNFPVAFNFPSGHGAENEAFVMGETYVLNVENTQSFLRKTGYV